MENKKLMQLFSDYSIAQNGKNYENRCIIDSDFDKLCEEIIKIHNSEIKEIKDENYELSRIVEDHQINGDH